jgi:hypothetical protein
VVSNFANFKVKADSNFPDLKVAWTSFPTDCGKWEMVTVGEDFTVQMEANFPDFKINSFTTSSPFPGVVNGPN